MTPTAMPGGAKEQVARLLALVPYLHSRGQVHLDEASADLGVSPEQLLRDLRVLLMCGLPGGYPGDLIDVDLDALEAPEGDGVIRISNADYLARPLRLTPTEASALIVALRALRESCEEQTREVVDRTLAKLEAAAAQGAGGQSVGAQVHVGDRVDEVAGLRTLLLDAVGRHRQVELRYFVPSRDEVSHRLVDPHAVVSANAVDYLEAWCHSAEAPRVFRLDRIEAADVLDTEVTTQAAPRRPLADGLFLQASDAARAVLRLDPPARWVLDYYPVEKVRHRRGGVVEVTMLVADRQWLERLLRRLMPHATVLEPAEMAESLRATAAATLGLYGEGT
ncbi:MAG: WYL domain-containing protein [Nocardioides sp.]|uniref:helix-turn-helix transcriptional regulator n=1 Tax=Nocardioides sp. TaxID=35761 RepID=UPI0039E3837A